MRYIPAVLVKGYVVVLLVVNYQLLQQFDTDFFAL